MLLEDGDVAGFELENDLSASFLDPHPATRKAMTEEERKNWAPSGNSSNDQTSTFCGTAEYLVSIFSSAFYKHALIDRMLCFVLKAPEVIQGLPYSYGVDWWSFGTLLYEVIEFKPAVVFKVSPSSNVSLISLQPFRC